MRTSITLSEEDARFISQQKLNVSTIAKIAIIDAINKFNNGERIELPQREQLDSAVRVSIDILPEHKGVIEALGLNLSALVREEIRKLKAKVE